MVYSELNCDSNMFQGHVETDKRINLLFVEVTRHYHVISNLTGAMAKRCVCEVCNKGCEYGVVHTCEHTCSDCMVHPPCKYVGSRILCDLCNRHLKVRHASITIKTKHNLKGRAHVSFVSVVVRVAL